MGRKFHNKTLPRGIMIDRGYVFIRIFAKGQKFQQCIGPTSQPDVISDAIDKLNDYRKEIRANKFDLDERVQRVSVDQACELYWQLHASKLKGARNYRHYLDLIAAHFKGRFIDTITYLDWKSYREGREKTVSPTTVNREHTVFTAMFNKLRELVRIKAIKPIKLPAENPGPLVRKKDE